MATDDHFVEVLALVTVAGFALRSSASAYDGLRSPLVLTDSAHCCCSLRQ